MPFSFAFLFSFSIRFRLDFLFLFLRNQNEMDVKQLRNVDEKSFFISHEEKVNVKIISNFWI